MDIYLSLDNNFFTNKSKPINSIYINLKYN